MNNEFSIYIPRMSTKWTEDGIRVVMQDHRIGTVSRVDFISIYNKPNVNRGVRSAVVHFSDPYFPREGYYKFRFEMYRGNKEFWKVIESGKTFKLQVLDREYWLCSQNKTPFQRTTMNISQVEENCRHLQHLITDQSEEIKKINEQRNAYEKRISILEQLISNHIRPQSIIVSLDTPPVTANCEEIARY